MPASIKCFGGNKHPVIDHVHGIKIKHSNMIFKQDAVREGELVLIYVENKPAFYARVEKITADVKPNWWQGQVIDV